MSGCGTQHERPAADDRSAVRPLRQTPSGELGVDEGLRGPADRPGGMRCVCEAWRGSGVVRWYAMSAGFLTDPKVEALGEKHGPAGPLVVISLMGRAALEEAGGQLEATYRTIAHETFIERERVEEIVTDAIKSRLCHEVSRDVTGCVLTFPAWSRWQAAGRKARQRAKEKEATKPLGTADVTERHNVSRDVPYKTVQDKTEKKTPATLCHLLADLIVENGSKRPTVTKVWEAEEDRLVRLDKRDPAEAMHLVRWSQEDSFWRANILSMRKFREQYDKLRLQAPSASVTTSPDNPYDRQVREVAA
jgi:hypothetical protein